MKILNTVLAMVMTLLIFAAPVHAKGAEKSSAELRSEAAELYERADFLVEKAIKKESEEAALQSDVKSRGFGDTRSRGYGAHACVMDCIKTNRGLYACRRACGAY